MAIYCILYIYNTLYGLSLIHIQMCIRDRFSSVRKRNVTINSFCLPHYCYYFTCYCCLSPHFNCQVGRPKKKLLSEFRWTACGQLVRGTGKKFVLRSLSTVCIKGSSCFYINYQFYNFIHKQKPGKIAFKKYKTTI